MYMLDAQYQFVMKLCLINLKEGGRDGGQLISDSYSYTVAPLHGRSNLIVIMRKMIIQGCTSLTAVCSDPALKIPSFMTVAILAAVFLV